MLRAVIGTLYQFAAVRRSCLVIEALAPSRPGTRDACSCDGFRMPARSPSSRHAPRPGAGVRKPPVNETAGGGSPISERYGDLTRAALAAGCCETSVGADC